MPYSCRLASLLALALCTVPSIGCGGGAQGRASVHGRVLMDGEPVESGMIQFIPTGGNTGPTAGGTIENGDYSIPAEKGPPVGLNRVEIQGTKKTGKKVIPPVTTGSTDKPIDEIVPPAYNTQSTLQETLEPGDNKLNFELVTPDE